MIQPQRRMGAVTSPFLHSAVGQQCSQIIKCIMTSIDLFLKCSAQVTYRDDYLCQLVRFMRQANLS